MNTLRRERRIKRNPADSAALWVDKHVGETEREGKNTRCLSHPSIWLRSSELLKISIQPLSALVSPETPKGFNILFIRETQTGTTAHSSKMLC